MSSSGGRAAPISAVNDGRLVFVRHTRCQAISDCEFKAYPDGDPWWRERTREQGERQLAPPSSRPYPSALHQQSCRGKAASGRPTREDARPTGFIPKILSKKLPPCRLVSSVKE